MLGLASESISGGFMLNILCEMCAPPELHTLSPTLSCLCTRSANTFVSDTFMEVRVDRVFLNISYGSFGRFVANYYRP